LFFLLRKRTLRNLRRIGHCSGPFFVLLLIMTQSVLPLIHGHAGYAEPVRGFHLPGFERLSNSRADTGASITGVRYNGLDVIVSVASGIESKNPDALESETRTLFALIHPVFSGTMHSVTIARLLTQNVTPKIPIGWASLRSRAPPLA
jgi:hypothetical protein